MGYLKYLNPKKYPSGIVSRSLKALCFMLLQKFHANFCDEASRQETCEHLRGVLAAPHCPVTQRAQLGAWRRATNYLGVLNKRREFENVNMAFLAN
jgi:hypothetical protein